MFCDGKAIAQGDASRPVGADGAAVDDVPRGAEAGDLDAARDIARNQVGLDERVARSLDRDPKAAIAQRGSTRRVGADRVARAARLPVLLAL